MVLTTNSGLENANYGLGSMGNGGAILKRSLLIPPIGPVYVPNIGLVNLLYLRPCFLDKTLQMQHIILGHYLRSVSPIPSA